MAEDFMTAAVKRVEAQFAKSGVSESYAAFERKEKQIEMRDGVKLHTIYYFPKEDTAEEKKYPVILTRTCYPGNDRIHRAYGEGLAHRGYVYVYQYCRGREQSEGKWEPNINERNDGIDTMNYLVEQPWCEILGYWGHSYTSMTGWAFADAAEGKVAAMFLEDYGTDRFTSAYEKGCFRHDILTAWSMENAEKPVSADYRESCRYLPQVKVDEALWGQRVPSYREYITSPNPGDALWQTGWWKQLREIPSKTKVPIYLLSGWYDHHHGSSMKTWERLNEETKQHSWLEIGAWNHFFQICLEDKEVIHPQNEEIPKMLEWFELTLKQKEIPMQRIRAYEIGSDRWIDSVSDGLGEEETAGSMTLYLDEKTLREDAPEREKTRNYTFDPATPVESIGGDPVRERRAGVPHGGEPKPCGRPGREGIPWRAGCRQTP